MHIQKYMYINVYFSYLLSAPSKQVTDFLPVLNPLTALEFWI
jgi:hypothetical protein